MIGRIHGRFNPNPTGELGSRRPANPVNTVSTVHAPRAYFGRTTGSPHSAQSQV